MLGIKVDKVGGLYGSNIEILVNTLEQAIDLRWHQKEDVQFSLAHGGGTSTAKKITDSLFRFAEPDLLHVQRPYQLEAREDKKRAKLLGTVTFELTYAEGLNRRGRVIILQQLLERTIASPPECPGWKRWLPWAKELPPEELRFNTAMQVLLSEGKDLVPLMSGVDIAITVSKNPTLSQYLSGLRKDRFVAKVRELEDLAHEADIRDAELITNRLVKLLFGEG